VQETKNYNSSGSSGGGVKLKLENCAEFIDATPSYVVSEALKLLFRRDDEFKHWLDHHPSNGDHQKIEGGLFTKTA
jgi:hypothetical protein